MESKNETAPGCVIGALTAIARWSTPVYQALHLLLIFGGVWVASSTLIHVERQVENIGKQIEIQAAQTTFQLWSQIDLVFINNKGLSKYFYESEEVKANGPDAEKVSRIAEMMLDAFDLFFTKTDGRGNPSLPGSSTTPRPQTHNYMKHMFTTSPVLCKKLRDTKSWYSDKLHEFAAEPCKLHWKDKAALLK